MVEKEEEVVEEEEMVAEEDDYTKRHLKLLALFLELRQKRQWKQITHAGGCRIG